MMVTRGARRQLVQQPIEMIGLCGHTANLRQQCHPGRLVSCRHRRQQARQTLAHELFLATTQTRRCRLQRAIELLIPVGDHQRGHRRLLGKHACSVAATGFRVFREAAVNLLIHQDYGDHSRKAVIQFHTDGIHLWNPGDSYTDARRLLEPGEKEVRNPAIAMALRRIHMCEQAGTGLRMMQREWQALGHAAPRIDNDRARKAYSMFLPDLTRLGVSTPEVTAEVNRLISIAPGNPVTATKLMELLALRDPKHFRTTYLKPALDAGLLEMPLPDKPHSSRQRYRLSAAGHRHQSRSKLSSSTQ